MKRYCEKCQKEFEFNINSMKDLDNLVCPDCGEKMEGWDAEDLAKSYGG